MDIKKIAYEKYKLFWMLEHRYTLLDLVNSVQKYGYSFEEWEEEHGFEGEIYAGYHEFLHNEFLNREYIQSILNDEEMKAYWECIMPIIDGYL